MVLGVALSELIGPVLTADVLRRAGEISSEVEKALALGNDREARAHAVRHTPKLTESRDDAKEETAE